MHDDEVTGPLTHESAARAPKMSQRLTDAALVVQKDKGMFRTL